MNILLVTAPGPKVWNGTTIYNQPLGGSESASIYLARSLARLGHKVVSLAPGAPGTVDGVEYRAVQTDIPWASEQQWDAVIVSRWYDILNNVIWKSPAILCWLHDMPGGGVPP